MTTIQKQHLHKNSMKGEKTNTAGKKKRKSTPVTGGYLITELDQYLFGQGSHYDIFRKLGAHPMTWKGKAELRLLYGLQMQVCM